MPVVRPVNADPVTLHGRPSATLRTITGTVSILGGGTAYTTVLTKGSTTIGCATNDGYSDLAPGASVTIKDGSGSIIGTGQLQSGLFLTDTPLGERCSFAFSVSGLPDEPFYSIEVSHRGAVNYSNADLAAKGWHVDLTVGNG